MKFKTLLLLITTFAIINHSFSQELSKLEKKNLKKELRKMLKDPSKLKSLKESVAVNKSIVTEQTIELNSLTKEKTKIKKQLEIARDSIGDCSYALKTYKKDAEELKAKVTDSPVNNDGMKYRLQIGLYKEFDISNFLEQFKIVSFEKTEDDLFRYTIGNFETEYDAELFKSALREMGIKDAFVSYYLDGQRIAKD